jgi:hypothetical protein
MCYFAPMSLQFKYRGKVVTDDDIAFIRQLILDNPNDSRWALSKKLCGAWNWIQPNGALKDMVCRGLMLELHRAGYIRLPAKNVVSTTRLSTVQSRRKSQLITAMLMGNCLRSNP